MAPKRQHDPTMDQATSASSHIHPAHNHQTNVMTRVHIPPFWDEQPDIWFLAAENQFELHHTIDDDAKYAHVLAALPQAIIKTVVDIIKNPPPGLKYQALKTALINRPSISEERRLDELLSGLHTMGDLSPSQFYRLLETKAGDSTLVNPGLLKTLWLKRLPDTLKTAVAAWVDKDIIDILPIADQIWVFAQPSTSQIAETARHPSSSKATNGGESDLTRIERQLQQTQQQLQDLQQMMSNMNINHGRSPTRRSTFQNRSRSRSPSNSGFCYFHRRFGPRARNCTQPCKFKSGATQGKASNKNFKPSENY